MKATFENSVNVLVKAYLNGTLLHCDCQACAVGNLVADSRGYNILDTEHGYATWKNSKNKYVLSIWQDAVWGLGDHNSDTKRTGYSVRQLSEIENAFEHCERPTGRPVYDNDDEWMFNGLMAVVDVLADIHGIDLTTKEEAKKLFVKA